MLRVLLIASLLHTPPVGFDGELIITPFVFLDSFFSNSLKFGSYCLLGFVPTKTGVAPVRIPGAENVTYFRRSSEKSK